ncbi:MAG: hypothetical protein AB1485_01065 [Candidatus Thermoplasmatota archaeon]
MKNTKRGLIVLIISFILSFFYLPIQLGALPVHLLFIHGLITLIILCIGLEFMWKGKREFGDKHRKFINIGSAFLIVWVILSFFYHGLVAIAFHFSLLLALLVPWFVLIFFLLGFLFYAYNIASKVTRGVLWSSLGIGFIVPLIVAVGTYFSIATAKTLLAVLYALPVYQYGMVTAIIIAQILVMVAYIICLAQLGKLPSLPKPPSTIEVKTITVGMPLPVKCPYCENTFEITPTKRPLKVTCPKCKKKSMLR